MSRYKTTAVSYLNTKPFLYGLFRSGMDEHLDISLDIPSECARKLAEGEAELGLIPVAALADLEQPVIISDYCIGADGPVKTVVVVSDTPIEQVGKILLDFHSRTSVQLLKILLREHWKTAPELIDTEEGFTALIGGSTAGLVIGDKAFDLAEKYEYVYDLSEEWKKMTGLPFVFAVWVSRTELPEGFLREFNVALQKGIDHIPQLIALMPGAAQGLNLEDYFRNYIRYQLDSHKKKALDLFLKKAYPNPVSELVFQ